MIRPTAVGKPLPKLSPDLTDGILRGKDAWRPRPPPDYLIDRFLGRGKVGMVAAYGSSMKSWLLLSLALSVASGSPWLGQLPAKPGPVLYLDYENDESETGRRIAGLSEPLDGFDLIVMPEISLTDPKFEKEIKRLVDHYRLICIDSLSAGSGGEVSENDSRFARPLQMMKRHAARSGCSFVTIHHTKKVRLDKDGNEIVEDPRMILRGTSALYAALDTLLICQTVDDYTSKVVHGKWRGGEKLEPFTVRIAGKAPRPVTLTMVTKSGEEAAAKLVKLAKLGDKILSKATKPLSANKLSEATGGNKAQNLEAIRWLVETGKLTQNDGLLERAEPVLEPVAKKADEPEPAENVIPINRFQKPQNREDP